ncbi:MAG: cobalt-precorrin-5B (C(1))-methyltransferase [Tagaea sp.]
MAEDELPPKPEGPLRAGWTTGACAAAAAAAAAQAHATGEFPAEIAIRLPLGQRPVFALAHRARGADWVEAGVTKDAGDDPDVTHGAMIVTRLRPAPPGSGLRFEAGEGVGTVTRPGLALPPGEPAINPHPRKLIAESLAAVAAELGGPLDWVVRVSIPGGAELAKKTLNARLGIVGGLSVLGTTGIVTPYSCAAWIHSIHRGIDVARAAGLGHVAASTGSVSESFVKAHYALPEAALIDMGDFAGGTFKYLRDHPIPRVTLAGGFAKLAKLAGGAMDLHSARSRVDNAALAALMRELGAATDLAADAPAGAYLLEARRTGVPLADAVAARARAVARATIGPGVALDVLVVDRSGDCVGRAGP